MAAPDAFRRPPALVCACLAATLFTSVVPAAQPRPDIDSLVAAYAAGDYGIVRHTIPTPADYREVLRTFPVVVATLRWTRPRAPRGYRGRSSGQSGVSRASRGRA
jgi:hypothetical protein